NAKNKNIEETLKSLRKLSDQSYKSIQIINNSDCNEIAVNSNNVHIENIKNIKTIINYYIPACIEQIEKSLGIIGAVVEQPQYISDTLANNYITLYKDINKQLEMVCSIKSYYNNILSNSILNGFQDMITKQSNGWKANKEEVYSLKTAVLNKNINGKLIPELKALMVNSDIETRAKINSKIKDITEFFDQQVEIERQVASAIELDYNKVLSININDGISLKKDAVEDQLKKIDFYIAELKKNW
ncbi:MAG: hypothetical protein J6N72_07310, partial [Psychrobacter sp.]|nr:hypothetical protein [Psychrobacter sp.]